MSAYQEGKVKWFRHDGTGYVTSLENPEESILFDQSVVKTKHPSEPAALERGQRVKFRSTLVMGRKVATDVQPL